MSYVDSFTLHSSKKTEWEQPGVSSSLEPQEMVVGWSLSNQSTCWGSVQNSVQYHVAAVSAIGSLSQAKSHSMLDHQVASSLGVFCRWCG